MIGLHLVAMNVLYPKILGKRLQLNPLAVTLSLLFWGWLWGAMGLILAVPITGAMKIICDHIEACGRMGRGWGSSCVSLFARQPRLVRMRANSE